MALLVHGEYSSVEEFILSSCDRGEVVAISYSSPLL
jgi:hypothetical protein